MTGEIPIGERSVVALGAGGIADGRLDTDEAHAMGPGWLLFASYGYRLVDERGLRPFLLGTASIGASAARTASAAGESAHFTAYDLRAGLSAGKSFGPATPYVAARVFGGPVLWTEHGQSLTGTDKYHYQPAVGLVLSKKPIDFFGEWAFLGERGVTAGVGISF